MQLVQLTLAVTIQTGEQLGLLLQLQQARHEFLTIQLKTYTTHHIGKVTQVEGKMVKP